MMAGYVLAELTAYPARLQQPLLPVTHLLLLPALFVYCHPEVPGSRREAMFIALG